MGPDITVNVDAIIDTDMELISLIMRHYPAFRQDLRGFVRGSVNSINLADSGQFPQFAS